MIENDRKTYMDQKLIRSFRSFIIKLPFWKGIELKWNLSFLMVTNRKFSSCTINNDFLEYTHAYFT